MKYLILVWGCILLIPFCGIGQTGPGGVGTTDGSSSLRVWLKSDDLDADGDNTDNPTNGTAVSQWSDFSGSANHFTQTGANRPTYTTGTFNAVNFDSNAATPQLMNNSTTGFYTNGSTFFVTNTVNTGPSHTLFDNGTFSLRAEQWFNTSRVGFTHYGVADYSTTIASPFGTNAIISYHKTGTSSNLDVRVNTATQALNIGATNKGIPFDRIGKATASADEASGDFFEILLYNNRLNAAQIIIVDNYLSAKYANIPIPIDVYNEDDIAAGNYDHDVAGIGRVNATNLHNDSQGTGIVRISNPTNLNNDEFFMWGHDNGTLLINNTTDIPTGITARFDRVWRVSEVSTTGTPVNVGGIDMQFDLSGITGITTSSLRLLIDSDNDGNFNDETPISSAIDLGGNTYGFNGVTALANNLRFTIALGKRTIITNRRITYRIRKN
ncbi:hypothetical protein HN014_02260 [Aquimarina sp. TRL1]|uniref:hypothetical protein n=1 Tax=Aquimarina sp. (strain TRL1) TaxID=2736252 RepID=UPI00158B4A0C|nr:hypothetical protein [Aquimarina sp. TRL1]QKX03789.1 hypothetical protein HN014_02260 [Aquimarina sp. TRL1]